MNKARNQNRETSKTRLPDARGTGKRILFPLLLILFPFFLLGILELALRLARYGDSYDLFVDFKAYGKAYKRCNPEYGKKYFYNFSYTSPPNDIFLKEKPGNGFRVFVMGSSSVWGFPYGSGEMFSRILHQRLQDSYPDRQVEVINTAITAVNSFTLLDRIDEILEEKPDVVLIYAGHNEFYGALGVGSKEGLGQIRWVKRLHLFLLDFKTYQLLRNFLLGIQQSLGGENPEKESPTATLMERIVANKTIEYKSKTYNKAHAHYYKNLDAIIRKAHRKNVPVVISELISNTKDLRPFCSVESTTYPAADVVFNEAVGLEKKGEYEKARDLYDQARDLDCLRFRASGDINRIIRQLSQKYGLFLVPMKSIFETSSPNGIIGNNLVTEHVHPNIDGYFLMADAFYTALVENGLLARPDPLHYKPSVYYRQNWGITEIDSIYADLILRQLKGGWPFKPDTIINSFIYDYKPLTIMDSLAYQAVRFDDISLEMAHKKIAQYYIAHNETEKACKEYQSVLRINPYSIKDYITAGDLALKTNNYDKALEHFRGSLRLMKENYALSRIGEIYILKEEYNKGIPYLEEVRRADPEFLHASSLELLKKAYMATLDTMNAGRIQAELNILNVNEKKKNQVIIYSSTQVKEYINQAITQLKSGKTNDALMTLQKANEIQETNVANRLVGEILLSKNDKRALDYFKKVYYESNTDPVFLNTLCYAYIHFNLFDPAQKILIELKQLDPGNPNIPKYERMITQRKELN
jgi:tetratricopeptide (TPR) repeat protein